MTYEVLFNLIIRAGDTTVTDARGKSGARVCSLQQHSGATGDHHRDNNEDNVTLLHP